MKNLGLGLLLSLMVSAVLAAAGPTAGEKAPPLNVDAVNDGQRGKYDVIDDAAGKLTVVYFLDMFSAQNEDNQAVGRFLLESYKANKANGLHAVAVIPGAEGNRDDLQAFCEAQQIDVPIAPVAYDDQDFAGWKMDAKLQSMLVVVADGKVQKVFENANLDEVQAALPEFLKKLSGKLEEGDAAPALHIDAVNDGQRGAYDVIEEAAGKLCFVYLIDLPSTQGEEHQAVALLLGRTYAENKDKGLHAAVAVTGGEGYRNEIQAYCEANQVTLPVAPIAYEDKDLAGWHMPATQLSMLVVVLDGKVLKRFDNIKADDLKAALPELLQKLAPAN